MKDKTTCATTDFLCMYWQTSYQFSDNQMGCYTPLIPFSETLINNVFNISLQIYINGATTTMTCTNISDCQITYQFQYTPQFVNISPAHFYMGQSVTIKVRPRQNTIDQLMNVKIGKNNCVPNISVEYQSNYDDMMFECLTGLSYASEKINNYMINFETGFTTSSIFFSKQDVDPALAVNSNYFFKSYAKIDSISNTQGSTEGGQLIIIKGKGFSTTNTHIYIDNDECVNTVNIKYDTISCITPKTTLVNLTSTSYKYLGSHGLRQRLYTNIQQGIYSLLATPGYPDQTNNLFINDIILQASTGSYNSDNYAQLFSGYFKAIYTGMYRFWSTSDDDNQLYISTDESSANLVKIIDFVGCTRYYDWVDQYNKTSSSFIPMIAGNYYYIEAFHYQYTGPNHWALGVEIQQNVITKGSTPLPNQINQVLSITISPKISRDLYQITIPSLNSSNLEYQLNCKQNNITNTLLIDPSWQANVFLDKFHNFINEGQLLVRKIAVNETGYFFDDNNLDTASYTNDYGFEQMYINLSGDKSTTSIPIILTKKGTKSGVTYLVFIDRMITGRSYRIENSCYMTAVSIPTVQITIPLLQTVSSIMTGTFTFSVTDKTTVYSTPSLNVRDIYDPKIVEEFINTIPILNGNNQVFMRYNIGPEVIQFYVRIGLRIPGFTFIADQSLLSGGFDNKPTIVISDLIPNNSTNLFFMPIPADFLYVKNTLPQVRVVSNGLEAACLTGQCSYNYSDMSLMPVVTAASYSNGIVTLMVDKQSNDPTQYFTITLGANNCTNLVYQSLSFTCTLTTPFIGGAYTPSLNTQLGRCKNAAHSVINLPVRITAVSPTTVNVNGGQSITITGTGFPLAMDSNFSIKAGGVNCKVLTISNTKITCIVGKQSTSDPLTIIYNKYTTSATNAQFAYFLPTATSPIILSITPASVAPGEKQFVNITFDNITSWTDLTKIIVKLVHRTQPNYNILMNPFNIINNILVVRFGGAAMGVYDIFVQLDAVTFADGNAKTLTSIISIDSISPNSGSINGGTILSLVGTNFLSTQINQMIFIGSTPCVYFNSTSNNSTNIKCVTGVPNSSTQTNVNVGVAVEQMIQYDSNCTINNGLGCVFNYTSTKTAEINLIENQSVISDYYSFKLNDIIKITGKNFGFTSNPAKLVFSWGEITITGGDKHTTLIGTISKTNYYGLFTFNLYDDNGIATHNPIGTSLVAGSTIVSIFLKMATLVVSSQSPVSVGEYGAIFKFYTKATDFLTNVNSNGNLLNTVTVCGSPCQVLAKNVISDASNNFQCVVNTMTPIATYNACDIFVTYYGLNYKLGASNQVTSVAASDYSITQVMVNNIDISLASFTIADPTRFTVQVTLASTKIDFANLRLIINNKYVFSANTPGVLNSDGSVVYSFSVINGLPAGVVNAYVHEDSIGFLKVPSNLQVLNLQNQIISQFNIKINAKIISPGTLKNLNSSYYGGVISQIKGFNLNNLITGTDKDSIQYSGNVQNILVCGIPATINSFTSTTISFTTPTIIKFSLFSATNLVINNFSDLINDSQNAYILEGHYDTATIPNSNLLYDNNPYTKIITTQSATGTGNTFVGVKIKSALLTSNFKIYLKKIKIFVGDSSMPGDFDLGWIEGSNDGSTWTQVMTIPSRLPFLWYDIKIDYTNFTGTNMLFKFIRLVPNANSSIAELKFIGLVVYDTSASSTTCDLTIVDSANTIIVPNFKIVYSDASSLFVTNIIPNSGSSIGGVNVAFTLSGALIGTETVAISIFGQALAKAPTISKTVLNGVMISRDVNNYNTMNRLSININTIGNVYSDLYYQYLDKWSDIKTWGGEYIPANGETAYIKNVDVLLDVANINLNTLVIENGSLTVADTQDYAFSASNILVRSGKFIVGAELVPFTHNFVLTLNGLRQNPALPIFGNKVLAILEGQLELHGVVRSPTYTIMTKTGMVGDTTIQVNGPVDWKTGDVIVIASSSVTAADCERKIIVSVANGTTGTATITLDSALLNIHYGDLEINGASDIMDMRAEVALLSRNVVIQGDSTSDTFLYGAHIMLAAMNMNMNSNSNVITSGKLSYIEVRNAGQAYQLGRYPIHFHMIGDIGGSYIRGCSIHDTYNRGVTIHGVRNFIVDSNVAYNILGHTYFIEDGVETDNHITNNIAILTRSSFSLLDTDYTPASFWITNPSNFIENNRACGSETYGFWFQIPIAPTGLNMGVPSCPREMPLGSFKNNVSHSNSDYGIRIFPLFNPKTKPCQAVDNITVFTAQAVFTNVTIYRNRKAGLMAEKIGNIVFDQFKVADCGTSSMEVSELIPFSTGMATIQNSFIVGKSKNPAVDFNPYYKTYALTTPRADRFLVNGIRFYSFAAPGFACLASCSRCELGPNSTDSDGRTIFFKNIQFDGTQTLKVHWAIPRRAIYRDLDGTLSGSPTPAWVTPYYTHLLVNQCKRDPMWDDGIICDNTVQVRRVAFSEAPASFNGQPIKIIRLASTLDLFETAISNNPINFSSLSFKSLRNPADGWVVPFITGYNYLISFADVGLDFANLSVERSIMWEPTDTPINLLFNYTYRRDEFNITGMVNASLTYQVANVTTLNNFNDLSLPYGTYYNNLSKKLLYMRMTPYNPLNLTNLKLSITAIQCHNNNCSLINPTAAITETNYRKWSDPSNWPNKLLPVDGDVVEIKSGWNMMMDINTPNLKQLTVNGNLFWDPSQDGLELKSALIFIFGGRLEIGNNTVPFTKTAKVTLTGNRFSPNLAISNLQQITNKVIANINELSLIGLNRAPYKARLLSPVKVGDVSFTTATSLNWLINDEIIITTTQFDGNQTERFTIINYNNVTGLISISAPFAFSHYGAVGPTVLLDNPLNPPANLDERAEIFMITRNIKLSGSGNWGCNIYTTTYKSPQFVYVGRTNLSNVEITNCGQQDTEYGAITFRNNQDIRSNSTLYGLSLHDNPYIGIDIQNSNSINLTSIVEFKPKKWGFYVMNSANINLNDINIVQMLNRTFPVQINVNMLDDTNSCFYICPETNTCSNVVITNSTCAGSENIGFMMDAQECTQDFQAGYPSYNRAYATQLGFMVTNGQQRVCTKSGNIITHNNANTGYFYASSGNLNLHENIIASNNLNGLIIAGASTDSHTRKQLKRAMIIGQNNENPICLTSIRCISNHICKQIGLIMSITNANGFEVPFKLTPFPLNNLMKDAQFGSFFDAYGVAFVNFEDQCPITQYTINSNEFSSDFSSLHNFRDLSFSRVLEENLFYFENPKSKWIGDNCGGIPCSGPNNILFKVTNFKASKDNFDSQNIKINPKWGINSTHRYVVPNFISNSKNKTRNLISNNLPTYPLVDGLSLFTNAFPMQSDCTIISPWNAVSCMANRKYGVLLFENLDPDAKSRSIAPVNITSIDGEPFTNIINSFMDHACEFGYPSHLKTPRFPSLIPIDSGRSFSLNFASTNPKTIKFVLTDPTWDNLSNNFGTYTAGQIFAATPSKQGILLTLQYSIPQTVLVYNFNTNLEIKSKEWLATDTFTDLTCGANRWTPVLNTLQFYITNDPSCALLLKTVNSIQLSLRFDISIEEFYSQRGDTNLIYNVAAALGIPLDQIRITNVIKGSTIALTHILQQSSNLFNPTIIPLDLTYTAATLIAKIQNGKLIFTHPLLEMSYTIIASNNTDNIFKSPTFTVNTANINSTVTTPEGSVFSATTSSILPITNNPNNKPDEMKITYIIVFICVTLGFVIGVIGALLIYRYFKNKKIMKKGTIITNNEPESNRMHSELNKIIQFNPISRDEKPSFEKPLNTEDDPLHAKIIIVEPKSL